MFLSPSPSIIPIDDKNSECIQRLPTASILSTTLTTDLILLQRPDPFSGCPSSSDSLDLQVSNPSKTTSSKPSGDVLPRNSFISIHSILTCITLGSLLLEVGGEVVGALSRFLKYLRAMFMPLSSSICSKPSWFEKTQVAAMSVLGMCGFFVSFEPSPLSLRRTASKKLISLDTSFGLVGDISGFGCPDSSRLMRICLHRAVLNFGTGSGV